METNPFAILELPHTATQDEIKGSYRRLVALYHPDNNPGFPVEATQKVRELNEAYAQARSGWKPPVGTAPGTYAPRPPHHNPPRRWDPPTPPPKPVGPTVPPPKFDDVPPPRTGPPKRRADAQVDELALRRAALVDDLVAAGYFASAADAARDHAVVDAFLPISVAGRRLRSCARYERLSVTGPVEPPRDRRQFQHAVPSLAIGGAQARQEAIDRLAPARFVACTDDGLLWTTSAYADGDGILLQEDIEVFSVPVDAVGDVGRTRGEVRIALQGGGALTVQLGRDAARALESALGG
ncbi:MAG: J domain-containing protein [Solirubrobacteraceae bacterium]|nr:J domain-containing protein [Solirubrobacteraceae bacterium]